MRGASLGTERREGQDIDAVGAAVGGAGQTDDDGEGTEALADLDGVAHDVVQAVDVGLDHVLDVFPGDRAGLVDRFPENAGPPAAQDERDDFIQFGTGNAMHADVAPRADFGQDVFVKSIDMFYFSH